MKTADRSELTGNRRSALLLSNLGQCFRVDTCVQLVLAHPDPQAKKNLELLHREGLVYALRLC